MIELKKQEEQRMEETKGNRKRKKSGKHGKG
jgi:hypothetical protein